MAGDVTPMTGMAKGTLCKARVTDFQHSYSDVFGYHWQCDVLVAKLGRYVRRTSTHCVQYELINYGYVTNDI